jgi:quercetin dioxygenase-like cupin family protein
MDIEVEKSKLFTVAEIIQYIPNSVVIKTILKKATGDVSVVCMDSAEALTGKISAFDTLIQVIDGKAEVTINGQAIILGIGEAIIIAAHSRNSFKANVRFKMISTVIKSGYEDLTI